MISSHNLTLSVLGNRKLRIIKIERLRITIHRDLRRKVLFTNKLPDTFYGVSVWNCQNLHNYHLIKLSGPIQYEHPRGDWRLPIFSWVQFRKYSKITRFRVKVYLRENNGQRKYIIYRFKWYTYGERPEPRQILTISQKE